MIIFKYCPQCRKELDLSGRYPKCSQCQVTYYRNSKPTAGVWIVRGDEVLVPTRAKEPFAGEYGIVGGFLEEGEAPESGAVREAFEETGLKIKIVRLLGVYPDEYGGVPTVNIHYAGKVVSGEEKAGDDIGKVEWKKIEEVSINPDFKNAHDSFEDLKKWINSLEKGEK